MLVKKNCHVFCQRTHMKIDFGHTLDDLVTALEPMLPKKSRKKAPKKEVV
jgi:hypothetical protein